MEKSIAIIMYCQRLFLLFTAKQHCLQTNKYDQSCGVTKSTLLYTKFHDLMWFCFQDMSVESEEDEEDEQNSLS